jgi:hypothetical protein
MLRVLNRRRRHGERFAAAVADEALQLGAYEFVPADVEAAEGTAHHHGAAHAVAFAAAGRFRFHKSFRKSLSGTLTQIVRFSRTTGKPRAAEQDDVVNDDVRTATREVSDGVVSAERLDGFCLFVSAVRNDAIAADSCVSH